MTADRVGEIFGNYTLLRVLGQGSFAEVYLGEHRYLERPAAIKILHVRLQDAKTHNAFRAEAKLIAHLRHPHLVQVLDFGIQGETPYLVMDYAPNGTLCARHPRGTPLAWEQILSYVKQIAAALDYAHAQHIIHRDIKPENLLLNAKDEIVVSDFGVAIVQRTLDSHSTQNRAGTPLYMAPEQIQQHPCAASDQYAVGVMVYEWLCGEPPFPGPGLAIFAQHLYQEPPRLRDRVPDLPQAVEDAVFGALAKDPQQRFATVWEFALVLEEAFFATQPLSLHASFEDKEIIHPLTQVTTLPSHDETKAKLPPIRAKPPVSRKARRRSLLALIPVSILVLLLVGGGLSYLTYEAGITATISVTPKVQGISQIFTLKAVPNSTSSNDDTVIQANVISLDQLSTLRGATSGRTGCTLGTSDCQQAVSSYDVAYLVSQLRPGLQKQLLDQIQNLANRNGDQLVGSPVFNDSTIASTPDVQSEAKSVSVSLTEQGSAEFFVKNDAQQRAGKLLQKLVVQKFGASYQLLDKYTQLSQTSVRSIDTNGVITITIATVGIASYQISESEIVMMMNAIKGQPQNAAQAYIRKQTGIDPSSASVILSAGQTIPTSDGQIIIHRVEPNILSLPPLKLPKLDTGNG